MQILQLQSYFLTEGNYYKTCNRCVRGKPQGTLVQYAGRVGAHHQRTSTLESCS